MSTIIPRFTGNLESYESRFNTQVRSALHEINTKHESMRMNRLAAYNNAASVPTGGTWAVGDKVWNSAPAEAGIAGSKYVLIGWICTVAGTPGTWLQMRTLTGN